MYQQKIFYNRIEISNHSIIQAYSLYCKADLCVQRHEYGKAVEIYTQAAKKYGEALETTQSPQVS